MKAGWQTKSISQVAQHSLGKMLDKAKNKGEAQPYLRNLNVRWGKFDLSDLSKMRFLPEEEAKYTVKRGDLVICEGGYPGRAAIWDEDETIHFQKALHRVRFQEPDHARWCLYYLQARDLDGTLKQHFGGTGIQHFTGEALARFELPIAPLAEQRRIVAILDEAFEGISTATGHAEKNLENSREVFESQREEALAARAGWDDRPLEDLCEIEHGFAFKSEYFAEAGDFVLLTPGNFFERGGYRDRGDKQKYYVGPVPTAFVLAEGDLLVAMTEQAAGLLGSPVVVPDSGRFLHNQRLGLVVPRNVAAWATEFFFHVFNTRRVRREIHDGSTGQKVRHTSPGRIGAVRVAFPRDRAEQLRVAQVLTQLEEESQHLENLYEQKLDVFDELKKSLLHQAFSGAL